MRLSSYCTKRANNGVNLVTSRNINTRLARPICMMLVLVIILCKSLFFQFYSKKFLVQKNVIEKLEDSISEGKVRHSYFFSKSSQNVFSSS